MEVCSRRRGLVTLGRIISSSQSVAYWSGPDNVNQLVKLVKISGSFPQTIRVCGRNPLDNQERSAVIFSQPGADRTGLLQT